MAKKIRHGQLDNLPASKTTSGTFAVARIPNLAISKITNLQSELNGKADTKLSNVVTNLTEFECSELKDKMHTEIQGAYNLQKYGNDVANGIIVPNGYMANYAPGGGVRETIPVGSEPLWDANFGKVGIVQAGITQQWNSPNDVVMFGEIGVVSREKRVIVKKGTLLIGEDSEIPISSYTKPLYAVYRYIKGSNAPIFEFHEAGELRNMINGGKEDVIIKVGELIQNFSSKYWYIRVDVQFL